jgi:hypothetical protein
MRVTPPARLPKKNAGAVSDRNSAAGSALGLQRVEYVEGLGRLEILVHHRADRRDHRLRCVGLENIAAHVDAGRAPLPPAITIGAGQKAVGCSRTEREMPAEKPLIVSCGGDGNVQGDLGAAPVPWWSVTKTCLAACALVLVARGRLALDDRLPDRAYTLRQLLQHTSGLGSYTERSEYRAATERAEEPWSDSELLKRVRLDPFLFEPGQGWSYSNTGYFLIRRLIEQTTDTDIDMALRTLVLAPLGIERTRIARSPADLEDCAWGNASGYIRVGYSMGC